MISTEQSGAAEVELKSYYSNSRSKTILAGAARQNGTEFVEVAFARFATGIEDPDGGLGWAVILEPETEQTHTPLKPCSGGSFPP